MTQTQNRRTEPFMLRVNRRAAEAQNLLRMSDADLMAHLEREGIDRDLFGPSYPILAATRASAKKDAARPGELALYAMQLGMLVPRNVIGYIGQLTADSATMHASNNAARQLIRVGMQERNSAIIDTVLAFVYHRDSPSFAFDARRIWRHELGIEADPYVARVEDIDWSDLPFSE